MRIEKSWISIKNMPRTVVWGLFLILFCCGDATGREDVEGTNYIASSQWVDVLADQYLRKGKSEELVTKKVMTKGPMYDKYSEVSILCNEGPEGVIEYFVGKNRRMYVGYSEDYYKFQYVPSPHYA